VGETTRSEVGILIDNVCPRWICDRFVRDHMDDLGRAYIIGHEDGRATGWSGGLLLGIPVGAISFFLVEVLIVLR
jgi:hypothetical protein